MLPFILFSYIVLFNLIALMKNLIDKILVLHYSWLTLDLEWALVIGQLVKLALNRA